MELLVVTGLTPFEALQTGTYNAAICLDQLNKFGTITPGKLANLILVDENPLVDIKNIKKIHGVMLHGQWLPISEIQKKIKHQ
ncbi:MAG TPA: amidohydrolase family protein [Bacillota bacterium]|nr:amidohydrolase family protein [Bacillota bacterium]